MSGSVKLADTAGGSLYYENGELKNKGHIFPNGKTDPVACRGSVPIQAAGTRVMHTIRGDVERAEGGVDECCTIQMKLDERYPRTDLVGQFTVWVRGPGQNESGTHLATLSHDGIEFHVPVNTAPAPGPVPIRVSRFYSDDGHYVYNVQGDPTEEFPSGRIVQYATHGTADESQWEAVAILRPELLNPL